MRIVAGTHRSRPIKSPKDDSIRPTSDKVRLAVFNMLQSRGAVADAIVLDAFCGTGALGLEALSQGAARATFWDKSPASLALTRENIAVLGFAAQSDSAVMNAATVKENPNPAARFTLVFLDPPYHKGLVEKALQKLIDGAWVDDQTLFVIETAANEKINTPLRILQEKTYGEPKIILAAF
jgi:16S rRNA (guanine966-N2)-methyltransferase